MAEIKIIAEYASINAVRALCEPWIDVWGGDEWGENMRDLLGACHTSYGFDDEDCAVLVGILWKNLQAQKDLMDDEDPDGGDYYEPTEARKAEQKCREARDYWRKGGNLTDWAPAIESANETLNTVPGWVYGE